MINFIDVPQFTTISDVKNNNFSLSATQYKKLCTKNNNLKPVSWFLDRPLDRHDLGNEVGTENYVDKSDFVFIKTKALQEECFLLKESRDATECIKPQAFKDMGLKAYDVLISKDSNVGEIAILEKDYPNSMLCGGLYRLPISNYKFYLLAFIKNTLFREQIDYMVPRGSTIRHGKTKFLECLIPFPNINATNTVNYISVLTEAIINKERLIRERYREILSKIDNNLLDNQSDVEFVYSQPTIKEIIVLDRLDSSLYSKEFKAKQYLVHNYTKGCKSVFELGFSISRGQNLQVSNIGLSIQVKQKREGYYTLILPNYISKYGTVAKFEYLGNRNKLKTLNRGDIIFGAEGNEKGRSVVITDTIANAITNIHGITLNLNSNDLTKSIFVKLFLDWYRHNGMIDAYAVGGNGGSLAIKYWNIIKFPNFNKTDELELVNLYYTQTSYDSSNCTIESFLSYDDGFNENAGIVELDYSMKYLQNLLDEAIINIVNDIEVDIAF